MITESVSVEFTATFSNPSTITSCPIPSSNTVLAFVERRLENKKSVERKFAVSRPQFVGGVDVMGIQQGELTGGSLNFRTRSQCPSISEVALQRHVVPLRHPECDEPGFVFSARPICAKLARGVMLHEPSEFPHPQRPVGGFLKSTHARTASFGRRDSIAPAGAIKVREGGLRPPRFEHL